MEYIRILTCALMTTDKSRVRILIYNDYGTEKFLNVFFPVFLELKWYRRCLRLYRTPLVHFKLYNRPIETYNRQFKVYNKEFEV